MQKITKLICRTIWVCLPKYFSSLFFIFCKSINVSNVQKKMKVNNVITNLEKKLFGKFSFHPLKNVIFILSTSFVVVFLRNVKSYIALIMVV